MNMEIKYPHYDYSPINRTVINDTICEWITREAINRAHKSRMNPTSFIDEDNHLAYRVITGRAYNFILKKPYGGDPHYNMQHDDDSINRDIMIKLVAMNRYLIRGKAYVLNPMFDIFEVVPTLGRIFKKLDFETDTIEALASIASSFSTAEIHRMISLSQVFPFVFNAEPEHYWYAKYSS